MTEIKWGLRNIYYSIDSGTQYCLSNIVDPTLCLGDVAKGDALVVNVDTSTDPPTVNSIILRKHIPDEGTRSATPLTMATPVSLEFPVGRNVTYFLKETSQE